jgi:hypothetical protein
MDIKKGLNEKVTVRSGDNGELIKMTERELAVASLVQHAMKGDVAAIKLVLQLEREAESVERAARAIEESKWTDEKEKHWQKAMKSCEELRNLQGAGRPGGKEIPL